MDRTEHKPQPQDPPVYPEECKDKVIADEEVLGTLLHVFQAPFTNYFNHQLDALTVPPEPIQSKHQDLLSVQPPRVDVLEHRHHQQSIFKPGEMLYKTLGFSVVRAASSLVSAGKGVFITTLVMAQLVLCQDILIH